MAPDDIPPVPETLRNNIDAELYRHGEEARSAISNYAIRILNKVVEAVESDPPSTPPKRKGPAAEKSSGGRAVGNRPPEDEIYQSMQYTPDRAAQRLVANAYKSLGMTPASFEPELSPRIRTLPTTQGKGNKNIELPRSSERTRPPDFGELSKSSPAKASATPKKRKHVKEDEQPEPETPSRKQRIRKRD